MSILIQSCQTWVVVHNDYPGLKEWSGCVRDCPDTEYVGLPCFVRVEERWNGHALRPCVGMRADQSSHVWTWNGGLKITLEPRQ